MIVLIFNNEGLSCMLVPKVRYKNVDEKITGNNYS